MLKRFKARMVWFGTLCFMFPLFVLAWPVVVDPVMLLLSGDFPAYVLKGKLFSEKFDIIHAGSALDQPTIGKWLFWFTVLSAVSIPYSAFTGWLADRSNPVCRLAFAVPAALLCLSLLCVLSWPLCMLIQYVYSMGFTPRRIYGLIYVVAGAVLVFSFLIWAVRKPVNKAV